MIIQNNPTNNMGMPNITHDWVPWTAESQKWFINQDPGNIFLISRKKLNPELAIKYKYLLDMKTAGILK